MTEFQVGDKAIWFDEEVEVIGVDPRLPVVWVWIEGNSEGDSYLARKEYLEKVLPPTFEPGKTYRNIDGGGLFKVDYIAFSPDKSGNVAVGWYKRAHGNPSWIFDYQNVSDFNEFEEVKKG